MLGIRDVDHSVKINVIDTRHIQRSAAPAFCRDDAVSHEYRQMPDECPSAYAFAWPFPALLGYPFERLVETVRLAVAAVAEG